MIRIEASKTSASRHKSTSTENPSKSFQHLHKGRRHSFDTDSTGGIDDYYLEEEGDDPFALRSEEFLSEGDDRFATLTASRESRKSQALEEMTLNKLRFSSIAGALYGRQAEVNVLKQAVEESVTTDTKQLVLIGGFSGVGKTVLVHSVKNTRGAAFVTGKFDQYNPSSPYAAVTAVCRELCDELSSASDTTRPETVQAVRQELIREMKQELAVLLNVVPALHGILGDGDGDNGDEQQTEQDLDKTAQQLHFAFRTFFRIVCQHFRPVIMLLDDLQWADEGSLELMEVLITDPQNTRLVVCGVYRSNEVDEAHILSKTRRDLQEKSKSGKSFTIREIQLGNLGLPEVSQVVASLLSMDHDARLAGLAELCYKRTQGNAFFLLSFLSMLEQQELLEFNLGMLKWTWDLAKIEKETASTDNVVALVSKKISGLSADLAKLLKVAATLGSEFQEHALLLVWKEMGHDETSAKGLLVQASEENFFEPAGSTAIRWVHDKIQEASLSLVPESELADFKFRIGTILLRGLDQEDRESHYAFLIVDLLDAAVRPDAAVHLEIAHLSCKASQRAVELSAYQSAAKYVQIGIKHLPTDGWRSHFDLALQLHSTGARVEGILANTERMQFYVSCVQDHAKSLMDKMPCYFALVDRMGTDRRLKESNELALDVLSKLGVKFPRNGAARAVRAISSVFATKKQLATLDMGSLPVLTASGKLACMRLLSSVVASSYLLQDNFLFLLSVVRMVQLTIQHGVCDESLPALATFGVCVSSVLGDFKTGSKYASMALDMLGPANKAAESKVIFRTWTFVLIWTNSMNDCLKPFLRGYKTGMLMGDTESATYCMFGYCWASLHLSKPLRVVDDDCRIYMAQMRDLGRMEAAEGTNNVWQTVLYLRDEIEEDCEIFTDLEGARKAFQPSRNVCRSLLFAILGHYEDGARFALRLGDSVLAAGPGANITMLEPFFRSISLYAMARRTKTSKYKRHARRTRKIVHTWLAKGNPNLIPHVHLLDAEDAALRGKHAVAMERYQKAISTAARSGCPRDAGLASERYADFLGRHMHNAEDAKYRIEEAIRFYGDWGATRKVRLLREAHAVL